MDVEKTIEFIARSQAKAEERANRADKRLDRLEASILERDKRLDRFKEFILQSQAKAEERANKADQRANKADQRLDRLERVVTKLARSPGIDSAMRWVYSTRMFVCSTLKCAKLCRKPAIRSMRWSIP